MRVLPPAPTTLPPQTFADTLRYPLAATRRDPAQQERLAQAYDAVRLVYADGGSLDAKAARLVAEVHRVAPAIVVLLASRAKQRGVEGAPTGEELLAQVRAGVTTEIEAPAARPGPLEYESGQKWSGD
jgi:hypothetical protein